MRDCEFTATPITRELLNPIFQQGRYPYRHPTPVFLIYLSANFEFALFRAFMSVPTRPSTHTSYLRFGVARIPCAKTSARSIAFCVIWVCIRLSSNCPNTAHTFEACRICRTQSNLINSDLTTALWSRNRVASM